ncbi:hypothetical protein URH17368_1564 [Alicyclobacillus hesperidum URH17-3-68]|nr:hypothetical protein URH17368_1564 [Alicyclobacillus hesperidum URH17-3-68]
MMLRWLHEGGSGLESLHDQAAAVFRWNRQSGIGYLHQGFLNSFCTSVGHQRNFIA